MENLNLKLIYRFLGITAYACAFLITIMALLTNNKELVGAFISITIFMVIYACTTFMILFIKSFNFAMRTPCIPIPDFLVLKIYKKRVDLHFLIWKESFHYAGNDIIGMKFVDSEMVPFKVDTKFKNFLYIFPKDNMYSDVNNAHLHHFRIAFQAAFRRLFKVIRHLMRVDIKYTKYIDKGDKYEKSLDTWRLGIHKKNFSVFSYI